jgi:hypothetical protein
VTRRPLLALAVVGTLAAACGSGSHPKPPAAASPTTTASAAATVPASPSPSPSRGPADVDPLSGIGPRPTVSVVVVKVDNAGTARPYQRGLGRAAIVYQELVESGETRFAAVFSNAPDHEVGPVRSVRESDIELLRQFGRVPVAFSGGNTGVKATFHKAVRAGQLLDASYDVLPSVYRLGEWRPDARNFFTNAASIAAAKPGAAAQDVGLRFGRLPQDAGTAATTAKAVFSGYVTVRLRYVPETKRYAVFQNKREMPQVAPTNVIIERVPIRMSRYVDVLGGRTPYTTTTGSGPVTVLRDGRAVTGTWRRLNATTGTRFLDAAGRDIPLHPGPSWILLLPTTATFAESSLSVG